jgi:hypothetical protein
MNVPKWSRKVHPFAAQFPMMPEDELEELALDIQQNGLRHPIVLDLNGDLIDGRNRQTPVSAQALVPSIPSMKETRFCSSYR